MYGRFVASLSRVCLAFFLVSYSLTAASYSIVANGDMEDRLTRLSTGYFQATNSAFRLPPGASFQPKPTPSVPPVGKLPGTGEIWQQITGKVRASSSDPWSDVSLRAKVSPSTMSAGAKALLKGGLAGVALTVGFDAIFSGVDWLIEEGSGRIVRQVPAPPTPPITVDPDNPYWVINNNTYNIPCTGFSSADPYSDVGNCYKSWYNSTYPHVPAYYLKYVGSSTKTHTPSGGHTRKLQSVSYLMQKSSTNYSADPSIPLSITRIYFDPPIPGEPQPSDFLPVPESEIDSRVDESYIPHEADLPLVSRHVYPDDLELETISQPPPVVKTVTTTDNLSGDVTTTETSTQKTLSLNTSVSPAVLTIDESVTTAVSTNGLPASSTTTTRTVSPDPVPVDDQTPITPPSSVTEQTGGSVELAEGFSLPIDCDFMPTICRFITWIQFPDDSEEPPLSVIAPVDQEIDSNFDTTIIDSGVSASCPPPSIIESPFLGRSFSISYDVPCSFATSLAPLLLAFSYIFAAAFVLRSL